MSQNLLAASAIASSMICLLQSPVAAQHQPRFRGNVPPEEVMVEYMATCGIGSVPAAIWDYANYLAPKSSASTLNVYLIGYQWNEESIHIIANDLLRQGSLTNAVLLFCPPSPDGYSPTQEVVKTTRLFKSYSGLNARPLSTLLIQVQGMN